MTQSKLSRFRSNGKFIETFMFNVSFGIRLKQYLPASDGYILSIAIVNP